MSYDGILFDLDGTLWDSTRAVAESWRKTLRNEQDVPRPPSLEELKAVMGMTAEELTLTLFPSLSRERRLALFDRCCQEENAYLRVHGGKLYAGVEDLLAALSEKGIPLFIVSNCGDGYIPAFLEGHGLGRYFQDWACFGTSGLEKWENIALVVRRNGLFSPLYVGDTSLDRESARRAGVPFVHAAYGFGRVSGSPAIQSPGDLLAIVL